MLFLNFSYTYQKHELHRKIYNMKYVYNFGDGKADGKADMKNLLGGKGANLAQMVKLKLPVPPGFTISTKVCDLFYKNNKIFEFCFENFIFEKIIFNNLFFFRILKFNKIC